jgi:hypothetical protein
MRPNKKDYKKEYINDNISTPYIHYIKYIEALELYIDALESKIESNKYIF